MPLEGQWARQQTPLRRLTGRERRILAGAVGVMLVAAIITVIVAVAQGTTTSQDRAHGCVTVQFASTMGAAVEHACGAKARAFCAAEAHATDPQGRRTQAACRRSGITS